MEDITIMGLRIEDLFISVLVLSGLSFFIFTAKRGAKKTGKSLAIGIKNNNPLNIKYYRGTEWLGSETHKAGEKFVIFKSPEYGIRAAVKILSSYRERDIATISEIIKRWSPEVENDTESYINFLVKATKIPKNQEIKKADYLALIDNMIFFENGTQPYSQAILKRGILLL